LEQISRHLDLQSPTIGPPIPPMVGVH